MPWLLLSFNQITSYLPKSNNSNYKNYVDTKTYLDKLTSPPMKRISLTCPTCQQSSYWPPFDPHKEISMKHVLEISSAMWAEVAYCNYITASYEILLSCNPFMRPNHCQLLNITCGFEGIKWGVWPNLHWHTCNFTGETYQTLVTNWQ